MRVMRWLSTALLCCVAAAAIAAAGGLQPIPPFGQRVTDLTGTLDAQQKQTLETQLEALERSKGSRVAILMLPTTAPEDIAQYSIRVTDAWKLSRSDGTTHDGVLLTVAKDDHRVRIDVGRDLEGAIPDAANARIIREYITPKFRAGDFYGGIEDAVGALTKLINDEPLPPPLADEESGDGSRDIGRGIMVAWFAVLLLRGFLSFLPAGIRAPLVGIGTGVACWLISGSIILAIVLGVLGGLFGLVSVGGGGFVGGSGRGGFGGGGGFSGGGGGGFSGGSSGGFSGGGASGSW